MTGTKASQRGMKMRGWPLAAAATLLAGACTPEALVDDGTVDDSGEERFLRAEDPVADSYIVVLDQPKDARARASMDVAGIVSELSSIYATQVSDQFDDLGTFVIQASEADAIALAADPKVKFVEENGRVWASATQTGATWGLDRIDQTDRPLNQTYTYNNDGDGVTAYIVDTGIRIGHTNFGGRARAGHDAIGDGQNSNDCNGHGTHVAGTVGSATYGVAKAVDLVAVRVLDCQGSGTDAGVIAGVNWVKTNAATLSGPAVANMSLGGGASTSLDNAVKQAIAAGVTFALAAGNENQNACNTSPSRVPEAITVGSSTSTDARSSFSNFGTCVDIFAPGSSITSTWNTSNSATSTISGTSMASPHVAGAAALVLAANPSFTPQQVRDALVNNASSNKITSPGTGSPNKLLNVSFVGGGNPDPDPDPDPDPGQGTPRSDTYAGTTTRSARWSHQSTISVRAGSTLTVTLTDRQNGSTGDADLYVRFGGQPSLSVYNCRPYLGAGLVETCTLTVPAGQTQAFVSVYGYTAGGTNFTGTRAWVE
jgi:serine protease